MNNRKNIEKKYIDDRYEYYAFISYKWKNGKWAKWLQRKLQSYALPAAIRKQDKTLSKRLYPVCLDKTHLLPGVYKDKISDEIARSKYLIVICSEDAHDEPLYIDEEIRFFLDNGGDPTHILPFIISRSDNAADTCFPPELQRLNAESMLVGVNIYDAGAYRAFLKLVAAMHGIKLTALEKTDLKRKITTGLLCLAVGIWSAFIIGKMVYDAVDLEIEKRRSAARADIDAGVKLYEKGDLYHAVETLVNIKLDSKKSFPENAERERLLAKWLNCYKKTDWSAYRLIKSDDTINDAAYSDELEKIISLDRRGLIKTYDLNGEMDLAIKTSRNGINEFHVDGQEIVALNEEGFSRVDLKHGEVLFETECFEPGEEVRRIDSADEIGDYCLLPDYQIAAYACCIKAADQTSAAAFCLLFDTKTGQLLNRIPLFEGQLFQWEDDCETFSYSVPDDESHILYSFITPSGTVMNTDVDIASKKASYYAYELGWTVRDIAYTEGKYEESADDYIQYFKQIPLLSPKSSFFIAETMTDMRYGGVVIDNVCESLYILDDTDDNFEIFDMGDYSFCYVGNTLYAVNNATGEICGKAELEGMSLLSSEKDDQGDIHLSFGSEELYIKHDDINLSGSVKDEIPYEEFAYSINSFKGSIDKSLALPADMASEYKLCLGKGMIHILRKDGWYKNDPEKLFTSPEKVESYRFNQDYLVVVGKRDNAGYIFYYDLKDNRPLASISFETETVNSKMFVMDTALTSGVIALRGWEHFLRFHYDVESNRIETEKMETEDDTIYRFVRADAGEELLSLSWKTDSEGLHLYRSLGNESTQCTIDQAADLDPQVDDQGNVLILFSDHDVPTLAYLASNSESPVFYRSEEDIQATDFYGEEECMFLTKSGKLCRLDSKGKIVSTVEVDRDYSNRASKLTICGQERYALLKTGSNTNVLDMKTGSIMQSIHEVSNGRLDEMFSIGTKEEKLMLLKGGLHSWLIKNEDFEHPIEVPKYMSGFIGENALLVEQLDDFCKYPIYSFDDLLEMGRRFIGSQQ